MVRYNAYREISNNNKHAAVVPTSILCYNACKHRPNALL